MFNRISHRYDLLNHVLSLGVDALWRRKMTRRLDPKTHERVLDLACGTGDVAAILCRRRHSVVGVDPATSMLAHSRRKCRQDSGANKFFPIAGDGLALPFGTGVFDAATVAFGIRNIPDRLAALKELMRVISPGGRLLLLEFTPSAGVFWKWFFSPYFRHVLPRIGSLISGDKEAYVYLVKSVEEFESPKKLVALMETSGFTIERVEGLSGGIATLFMATVPKRDLDQCSDR